MRNPENILFAPTFPRAICGNIGRGLIIPARILPERSPHIRQLGSHYYFQVQGKARCSPECEPEHHF